MMNNPLMELVNLARNGGNPMMLMQQMTGRNPQMQQAMSMIQGKTPEQLKQMAENMAKERGMTVEQVAKNIGLM